MNIRNFKPGDCIYRNEPARSGEYVDKSYLTEKMIFIGIKNDTIYCVKAQESEYTIGVGDILELEVERGWDKGWAYSKSTERMIDIALEAIKKLKNKKAVERLLDEKFAEGVKLQTEREEAMEMAKKLEELKTVLVHTVLYG